MIESAKRGCDDDFLQDWHGFSFDRGLIMLLWMVVHRCRESVTGRDAVALMRKVAAKELFWDALLHTSVGDVQMLNAEEGMDKNGFVPELERFKIAKKLMDRLWRTGIITFCKVGRRNG